MTESRLPEKIKPADPFHSAEEIMEIPVTKDGPPKFSRDSDEPLQASHGNDRKSGEADVRGFGTVSNSPLCHTYWGEEMSGVPRSHNFPLSRKKTPGAPYCREWCSASSVDRQGCIETILSPYWGELKTESPATKNVGKFTQESYKGSKESGDLDAESVCRRQEASINKQSHRDGGNLPFVGPKMETQGGAFEEKDPALLAMFHAVANSRLAVRSQQKDEPDFTSAQKLAILQDLYHTKPLVFLERFRTALREEHLSCFRHLCGHYEADFYCAEVRRAALGKTRHTRVRNKRYAALQQLIRGGEYFSDEQMRCRDPLLYEQYIGQYLSDEELQALGSCKLEASCSLSGALLDSYQEQVIQQRLQVQQEQEEACEEEEEDDSDRDGEDQGFDSEADEWVPDQEEKAFLREEFTSRMYQRFLDGKDGDFDYSEVDENPDFDNLDIVSRDEEERYFDGEEPEVSGSMETEEEEESRV